MHPFEVFDDGKNGVLWYEFNKVGNVKWKNPGGDWLDASGDPQGTVPFSYVDVQILADPQWIALPVPAEMVEEAGGRGVFLLGVGGKVNCRSREYTDATLHPYMVVMTDTGTFACPCTGDVWMASTTSYGLGQEVSMSIGRALVKFDMSTVSGNVVGGTIYLNSYKQYDDPQIQLFKIDSPLPATMNEDLPVVQGLAANYPNDVGIGGHPSVLATWDWPEDWRTSSGLNQQLIRVTNSSTSVQMEGSPDQRWWLKVDMPVDSACAMNGEGTGLSVHYDLAPIPASIDPIPMEPTHPLHVFFRYSVMLAGDWTSEFDRQMTGGKFPGLDGRFGYPRNGDYWQSICGNGGDPGLGRYVPAGVASSYAGFCGWSARSQWHAWAYNQSANPMKMTTPIGSYLYYPEWTKVGTGEVRMWRDTQLEVGVVYDVEQEIQMNDVTGPYDQYGNGVPVPNGVFRAWLNGKLVEERTDVIWRKHPFIGIQSAWYLFKNGGTLSPCLPHTVYAGPAVVATEYIGPRRLEAEPPPPPPPPPPSDDCEPPYPAPEGCVWEHSWVLNCDEPPPPPPEPTTALEAAALAVTPGQCVEFPAPSLLVPDSSGSRPFDAPPGSGGVPILDWASSMDYDPISQTFHFSGGRPATEAPPQKMIWYDEIEDKWDSRGNWSGGPGGHIYRCTTVAPLLGKVLVERGGLRVWDVNTQTFDGMLPGCPYVIGGKSSTWKTGRLGVWHPSMGTQGSLVMMNQSWCRVNRFDWETQAWTNLAMLGAELWANQHLAGHYVPAADEVIGGFSGPTAPASLAIVSADGSVRLSAPAPCQISTGGSYGGVFVPHPSRAASISFCKATGKIWSYEFATDAWVDRGPLPVELNKYNLIGGTVHGVVFVASRENKTFIYKPDF